MDERGDGLVEVGLARELVEGLHAGDVLRADGARAHGGQQDGGEENPCTECHDETTAAIRADRSNRAAGCSQRATLVE